MESVWLVKVFGAKIVRSGEWFVGYWPGGMLISSGRIL